MENQETEETDIKYIPDTTMSQFVKSEIDVQISTAKAFPRSLAGFKRKALSMATLSEDIAASCEYGLPRRELNKATGLWENKIITGPSVRLAEIVMSAYGNIRAGARVVDNDGRTVTAQGICHDLESNTVITMEVKRSIRTSKGAMYSDDMQVVTGNAACAIAFRNAVFKIIPAALITDIYEAVQEVAKGTKETLIKRRDKALQYFTDQKITEKQICDVLEIKEIEDIDIEMLAILSSMRSAVKNGEGTLAELFTPKQEADEKSKEKASKATQATNNALKKAIKTKKQ